MQNSAKKVKPKICFFNSSIAWGGGEKWHLEVAIFLFRAGYDVHLAVHTKCAWLEKINAAGLPYTLFNISNLSFLNPLTRYNLFHFFATEKFDIVIFNMSADIKTAAPVARKSGTAHIIYRRGSAIPIRNTLLNRYLFSNIITEVIANSQATKRTVLQNNPSIFPENKITVLYNGLDFTNFLSPQPSKYYTKVGSEVVIGNLGRLEKQKAQHFLIDIAVRLSQLSIDFKILIGGTGRLETELKSYADNRNVSDKIAFVGFVNNVPAFMQSIDIFALTSIWEGFGYVLAEAMVCGKPAIAFDTSSNPELVEHGSTGFLVPEYDIEQFVQYIKLLTDNQQLRKSLGDKGQARMLQQFSSDSAFAEIEKYLLNLLT